MTGGETEGDLCGVDDSAFYPKFYGQPLAAQGTCVLDSLEELDEEALQLHFTCGGEPSWLVIRNDGPTVEWLPFVGASLEVHMEREDDDITGRYIHWATVRDATRLLYAAVIADVMAEAPGNAFAPLVLAAQDGACPFVDATPDSGFGGDGFGCAQAQLLQLAVGLEGDPAAPTLLSAGQAAMVPAPGGSYMVDVRTMVRGTQCSPDFPEEQVIDVLGFAVAWQPD